MTTRLRGLDAWITRTSRKGQNTIKTKRSSGLFSSFVRAVGWSASFLLWGASGLDGRSNH